PTVLYALTLHDALPISTFGRYHGLPVNRFSRNVLFPAARMGSKRLDHTSGIWFVGDHQRNLRRRASYFICGLRTNGNQGHRSLEDRKSTRLNSSHVKIS